jgi:sterol desaturase/sphingolipid hydroxylase (fatty acid hydroxylase superfamily)
LRVWAAGFLSRFSHASAGRRLQFYWRTGGGPHRLDSETSIRVGAFICVFVAMALWEVFAPRRPLALRRSWRWPNNIGVAVLNAMLQRVLLPAAAVAVASAAELEHWGLLNNLPSRFDAWLPGAAIVPSLILSSVILLDLVIYLQHVMFHAVPALWRVHRMHHADLDFDVTTGARFHPLEILISMVIKIAAVAAIGPPPEAVVIFEVVLNATSMFNHSNVRIPAGADRVLRWLLVTPDMHRVHHSVIRAETNSNFGFNLSWWDRALGTCHAQPERGHLGMTIGLDQFRDPTELRLDRMLLQPWRGEAGVYPLGRQ